MLRRSGFSLLEMILVIGILALLIGLLLPAVQRVRETAARMQSANNLRQIQLAVQNFASVHNDRVPALNGDPNGPNPNLSVHGSILPYIEQGAIYQRFYFSGPAGIQEWYVPTFVSPADPSLTDPSVEEFIRARRGYVSYPANAWAFQPGYALTASYSDGTSNSIAFAEHYAHCGTSFSSNSPHFLWTQNIAVGGVRRASFADGGPLFLNSTDVYRGTEGDVYPVTKGNPPVSEPAFLPVGPRRDDMPPDAVLQPITTPFQTAPAVRDCHPLIPQTPHRSGMLVGLMDGSVRTLAPGISTATFWGAVTPNGGEVFADW